MKNYKVEVSRGLERYTLIRKAENEQALREALHSEGFSIMTIEETWEVEISWDKYHFEIIKAWQIKTGTIVSNDIFKAYLKIKDELQYNLLYIYPDPDTPQDQKEFIMKDLNEKYRIYLEINKKQLEKKDEEEKQKMKVVEEISTDSFHMKKELEEVRKIIDKVLEKLKIFIDTPENNFLTFSKKLELKNVYTTIIRLKDSTNIAKLRQVWELALQKIGEIEVKIAEANKNKQTKALLGQTNKLLKEIGSKQTYITKDQDIKYILTTFFKKVIEAVKPVKIRRQKILVDTTSNSYLNTKLLIEKYDEKLKQTRRQKLMHFYIYIIPTIKNIDLRREYYLREITIKQNISLLKLRLTGKLYSYTKLKNGYYSLVNQISLFFQFLKTPFLIFISLYSAVFTIISILSYFNIYTINLNFVGMFYFLFIQMCILLLIHIRWLVSLGFNVVILSFLFIFWVINF